MTLEAAVPISGPYVGNGVTRFFPYNYRVDEIGHLRLVLEDPDGAVYHVTTNFSADVFGDNDGGVVTFPDIVEDPPIFISGTILPAGWLLEVERILPFDQPTEIGNQGGFFPQTHEHAFDYLAMQIQQIARIVDDTVGPPGPTGAPGATGANGAGIILATNVSGVNDVVAESDPAILVYSDSIVLIRPPAVNSGPMRLNLGPGLIPWTKPDGSAMEGEEISPNQDYLLRCAVTSFRTIAPF